MAFVDEIDIDVRAGSGGDGAVRWIRERGRPKGGPAGGNGGNGGDVYLVGVRDLAYLAKYRHEHEFAAEDGVPGGSNNMHGRNGEELEINVPVGSVVTNTGTGLVYEVVEPGQRVKILSGGNGGWGNAHFKGPDNQRPMQSTKGKPGEEGHFHIELRLVADIGLIGFPNAGKSSLLNALTNAHSDIGAYPFTTLEPHLGNFHGYILADIPGIISGAAQGKGLGHKFLRHITRTKTLLHLIAADENDVLERYKTIRDELSAFDSLLGEKEEIIVLSKVDLVTTAKQQELVNALTETGREVWLLSVKDKEILRTFTEKLSRFLGQAK